MIRSALTVAALAVALAAPGNAAASGGNYRFDGGTAKEQKQVTSALNASSFDWNVVPAQITVHIGHGSDSEAAYGEIWLDADLLDSGVFSWGTVQHEYAHQVDFFLLSDVQRGSLAAGIGGSSWWAPGVGTTQHGNLSSERFASTLAWTYWQSSKNSMKPRSKTDESAAMAPAAFKSLLGSVLAGATQAA